jgi:hypothetical protein
MPPQGAATMELIPVMPFNCVLDIDPEFRYHFRSRSVLAKMSIDHKMNVSASPSGVVIF